MFVPSHAQGSAFAWVDEVVYRFVVDLDEGKVDLESSLSLFSLAYVSEGVPDGPRNDPFGVFAVPALNGIGLARARLPICKNGGVVPLDNPLNQFLHANG